MKRSCEAPVLRGEKFVIKDFDKPEKPILAQVSNIDNHGDWQLVSLFTFGRPRSNYDMNTRRRLGYGIYTSSNGSLLYLRTELVGSEIPRYFSEEQLEEEKVLADLRGSKRFVIARLGT